MAKRRDCFANDDGMIFVDGFCVLMYNTVMPDDSQQTFRRDVSPYSGSSSK